MGSEDECELDDRWWLGWRGLEVRQVEQSMQGFVVLIGERSELTLSADFTLRPVSGAAPETHAVIAKLVGDVVLSSVAFKTGELRLVFQSGLRLDTRGRAWSAVGESERTWTRFPGAPLATSSGPA
jgi:hypothetical protein